MQKLYQQKPPRTKWWNQSHLQYLKKMQSKMILTLVRFLSRTDPDRAVLGVKSHFLLIWHRTAFRMPHIPPAMPIPWNLMASHPLMKVPQEIQHKLTKLYPHPRIPGLMIPNLGREQNIPPLQRAKNLDSGVRSREIRMTALGGVVVAIILQKIAKSRGNWKS
eukprot:TRINITY_DN20791_c0_g1::TRINITY_DN20791_c0_g1_i1::g.10779::m.10779 TRINITY_DN20791_c0_g1::TRINITY_DN20791_c0_g1_i1::g.10779  ORF type:complete len:163 (+),score=-31.36,Cytokin_check_N/PF10407.4/7.5e+02,Cytokin_check_N/PF10407.4/1 TRINITY_DN20791_c0_g1_i1:244-732(+)